ncbi:MAG: DUF58 domain-containing protein [Rhodobacterales bacterium]|nr:MAG: DUF58 domain-containing protein [Rhodobacterales bacterium]
MIRLGAAVLVVSAVLAGLGTASGAIAVLWGLIGLAALGDVLLSIGRPKRVTLDLAEEVFTGETTALTLRVAPAPPGLRARLDYPEGFDGPEEIAFTPEGTAKVTLKARRRGLWPLARAWLIWPSRLGLFDFVPKVTLDARLRVVPNIRLVQSGQITVEVRSTLYGTKDNRAIGEGHEFHQMRDFVPGMDRRSIDWKRSAHRGALVAKEQRAERNHQVIVALDNGYLMREEIAGLPKIDHAINAALAIAWAAAIGGDLVGFYSYDVTPRDFAAPEPGRLAFARLRARTADMHYTDRATNHTLAMTDLGGRCPKRSLIVVFTDFVDSISAELMLENLAVLAKRHLIIFVTLRDPGLEARVNASPDDMDGVAELVAAAQALSERHLVLARLARMGVTVVDAEPGQLTARLVSTYLDIKARELI